MAKVKSPSHDLLGYAVVIGLCVGLAISSLLMKSDQATSFSAQAASYSFPSH